MSVRLGTNRVKELAKQFGVDERQVVIALNYAAANREEIDARIRSNDSALDEAEQVAGENVSDCLLEVPDRLDAPA